MYAKAAVGAAIVASVSLIQSTPAPVAIFVPLILDLVPVVVEAGIHFSGNKRDFSGGDFSLSAVVETRSGPEKRDYCMPVPSGVPENVIANCCSALTGASVEVNGNQGESKVTITGIPYDCISAAPWFDGTGTVPYACGDDCLEWANLPSNEYQDLKNTFESL